MFDTFSEHGPVHQLSAPLKYPTPHVVVSFGPAGQLIRVSPGLSTQEHASKLEIHSLEVGSTQTVNIRVFLFSARTTVDPQIILSETQQQQDMRSFPGPLARY